jgi:hypothetical protein
VLSTQPQNDHRNRSIVALARAPLRGNQDTQVGSRPFYQGLAESPIPSPTPWKKGACTSPGYGPADNKAVAGRHWCAAQQRQEEKRDLCVRKQNLISVELCCFLYGSSKFIPVDSISSVLDIGCWWRCEPRRTSETSLRLFPTDGKRAHACLTLHHTHDGTSLQRLLMLGHDTL